LRGQGHQLVGLGLLDEAAGAGDRAGPLDRLLLAAV
jgi:hypothetical protein